MGILNFATAGEGSAPPNLPSGSFTMDRAGNVVATTLPRSFPQKILQDAGDLVLSAFRQAEAAHLPLTEFSLHFSSLKITAREMRGGAIVFLMPHGYNSNTEWVRKNRAK